MASEGVHMKASTQSCILGHHWVEPQGMHYGHRLAQLATHASNHTDGAEGEGKPTLLERKIETA